MATISVTGNGASASIQTADAPVLLIVTGDLKGGRLSVEVSPNNTAWAPLLADNVGAVVQRHAGAVQCVLPAGVWVRVVADGLGAGSTAQVHVL